MKPICMRDCACHPMFIIIIIDITYKLNIG